MSEPFVNPVYYLPQQPDKGTYVYATDKNGKEHWGRFLQNYECLFCDSNQEIVPDIVSWKYNISDLCFLDHKYHD